MKGKVLTIFTLFVLFAANALAYTVIEKDGRVIRIRCDDSSKTTVIHQSEYPSRPYLGGITNYKTLDDAATSVCGE